MSSPAETPAGAEEQPHLARNWWGVVLAITAAAAALRLVGLGAQGLWTDECSTAVWARLELPELLAAARADCQAPLFYLLEHAVLDVLGTDEWAVRLLPALAGIASVVLVAVAGRRLVSPRAGLFAALLLATSPLHVHYSREARNYTLLGLLVLAGLLLAVSLLDRPGARRAVLLGLVLVATLATHDIGPVHGLALAAGLLPGLLAPGPLRAARWKAFGLAGLVALLGYSPWLATLLAQTRSSGTVYAWAERAFLAHFPWNVPASFAALSSGAPVPMHNFVAVIPPLAWLTGALFVALGACAVMRRSSWSRPAAALPLAAAVALPPLALFAASLVLAPVHVVGRVEAGLGPVTALLVAAGLARLPGRAALLGLVFLGLCSTSGLVQALGEDRRSHEQGMARALADVMQPGETLVVTGTFKHAFEHYLGRMRPGVRVVAWPTQLEQHPAWIDWSADSDDVLRAQAQALAASLLHAGPTAGVRHVTLLLQPGGRNALLGDAFDAEARLVRRGQLGPWGHVVRQYAIPPAGAP